MDSYQSFVQIFKGAIVGKDYETLTNILKNGRGSLKVISTEHLESIVLDIFGQEEGLLNFLEENLKWRIPNKHLDDALKEGFIFLEFLIENFHKTTFFAQYIHQIKDVCQLALRVKCPFYTQTAASHAFMILIERFSGYSLNFSETIRQFVARFNAYNGNERKFIYCVIGKIFKHNGNVNLPRIYVDAVYKQLYLDSSQEYELGCTGISRTFHLYFDAVSDMLDGVEPIDYTREKLLRNLYKWIKNLSNPNKLQRFKIVIKSAIELLNHHVNQFRDLLYADYKYWYNVLKQVSREKSNHGPCGQRALKTFYRVIGEIFMERNNEETKTIFLYFLEEFWKEFENADLDLIMLRLTVYGFSQMAAPCKIYLPDYNVRTTYSIIASYALPLCSSEQSGTAHIENICCYQEALSELLHHMSDVTIEKINVLVKLGIYTIKRFPDLAIFNNRFAILSLIKTICNLRSIGKSQLQRYLDNIIYDGIAWSCSHTLALDAELQQELENLRQRPVCYKNYLLLWTQLLNAERYHGSEQLAQRVANTLTNVCLMLIGRLDIRIKQQSEDTAMSDVAFTQTAMNQTDFRVFTNLVDLYIDVMNASDPCLYADTVHEFVREIVRLSYRHPLISGFYKLARSALKILDRTTEEREQREESELEIKELLSSYLASVLDLVPTFSNELLIACLYLILDAPGITRVAAAAVLSARTIPAFRIALTMGLSDLELAYTALAALETWTDTQMRTQSRERAERTNELLREIVPHLESYLRSAESAVEMSQDLTTTTKKTVKRVGLIDTECTLRNFQRRVLLFLGSLDSDVLSNLVHERSLNTGASWDRKDLLKYTLALPDARLTIYFDRMLPRIIALARGSSDRRTRIAACEVLHSIVALIIGLTMQHLSNRESSFVGFYAILCPALLALGCDSDDVVRDLFQPLTLQLMRWLSSRFMLLSLVTSSALDSLFDGLCDDVSPSLREFSGICLAEFTRWSFKEALDDRQAQTNVQQIVRRINHLALHPSARKRVAAAVAFNHLYAILREDDETISTYWLELFYCFVRSMDRCDDPAITNALSHIEKVIRFKADVLNVVARDRRKPCGATLNDTLHWLLSQCGTLDEHCRARCMELYVSVSRYAVGGSARETTRSFVETHGIDRLNEIILEGCSESTMENISADSVKALSKALHYYTWLIEEQLLPPETLFPARNDAREHAIFVYIRNSIQQFLSRERTATVVTRSRELELLQTLQCKALTATLNFARTLLNVDDVVDILPESLWNESLFVLTVKCVMCPRTLGFDVKNLDMTDKLPHVLETLLYAMRFKFNDTLADSFRDYLSISVQKYAPQLLNLREIAQNDSCNELIQHVNGLMLLQRCGLLDQSVAEIERIRANRADAIERIFEFLVNERIGELICSDLSAQMTEYLRTLMELQLSRHDTSTTETLVRLISNDTLVIGMDSTKITHGEHFLNTFRDAVSDYMLKNVGAITYILDKSPDNLSFQLKWLEDLLLYLQRHRRELRAYMDDAVDVILRRFARLSDAVASANNVNSCTERLINIYGITVRFSSKPMEIKLTCRDLYNWIVQELINTDIEYKTHILRNFLVCLTDATDRAEDKAEWVAILRTLKNDGRSICPQMSTETGVSVMKVINCFETLLVLLSVTGSIIMLDCVIHFAAGVGDRLFDDKLRDHLRRYYRRKTTSDTERVLRSLEMTYRMFTNTGYNVNERLDILRGFLVPAFEFCDASTIERFFERNIRELYAINRQCFDNVKQTIVSKIGCYQLLAIMFAQVELSKICDANSAIARNAGFDKDRSFLRQLIKDIVNFFELKIDHRTEILRLLYCATYNCMLAFVSLKREKFTYLIFGEKPKGNFLWKNIVDSGKRYRLGQTFREVFKTRETTINVRSSLVVDGGGSEAPTSRRARENSYIRSYDLSASTLNEDINAYDLNRCVLLPNSSAADLESGGQSVMMNVALENDDFNEHECMPHICGTLRHIESFRGHETSTPAKRFAELPVWLRNFIDSMQKHDDLNIQLFMLKIVANMADAVFKYYARFMLLPIVSVISDYLEKHELNYIITDVLEIAMDWSTTDEVDNMKVNVQRLFEVLIDKVLIEKSDNVSANSGVYNYNLGLIETMAEKWRGRLAAPIDSLIRKMTSAPRATVYLVLVMLRDHDGMAREIIDRDDIVDFLLKLLNNWQTTDENTLRCCECLGLYLKLLRECREDETATARREYKADELKGKIFAILVSPRPRRYDQDRSVVKRIDHICRACPDLATDYINVVIGITSTNKSLGKSHCLEIFALSIPRLGDPNLSCVTTECVASNLRRIELQSVLANRMSCERIALRIVRDVVTATAISPADLLPYVTLTIAYVEDNSTECRELVYDILMAVYKKYQADVSDDASVTALRSVSVRNLLAGVLDPSHELQQRVLRFWTEETSLGTDKFKERLIAMLDMHSPPEDAYALLVPLLMLHLASRSIDYQTKLFEPLQDRYAYENYKIAVSWRRRNLSCVTPMFVDSLASQMSCTFSQSVDNDGRTIYNPTASSSYQRRLSYAGPRVTQELQFEPTVNVEDDHDNEADAATIFDDLMLGGRFDPETTISSRQSQPAPHDKRFRRFRADVGNYMRRQHIEKNVRREEMMKLENVRQRSSVKLYRSYRIGHFPDIEISHSSLIEPLQQLIKLDRLICKDITVSLLCSLIVEKEKSDNCRRTVVEKLKRILCNSERDSSFNATILETLLMLNVVDCDPRDIVRVSKANGLNVLGALLLERSLLPDAHNDGDDNDDSPTSSKRMKRDEDSERNDKWVQLASLYKSLNDVDIVLSIFREQSLGEDVQEAAVAEVNGDWKRARIAFERAYERTKDVPPLQEHCLQGLIEAANNLCDWSTIDDLVKSRANGSLNNIWEDAWRDWMIPCVCDAYVQILPDIDGSWPSRTNDLRVIESWMRDRGKLEHIKSLMIEDLMVFLMSESQRQAGDLLNDLLDSAAKQWVSLSPLCTELGMRKMQKLQAMNDLDASLKVLRYTDQTDYLNRMTVLLDFWSAKAPMTRDNLVQWNKLAAYRTYCSMLFEDIFENVDVDEERDGEKSAIRKRMRRIGRELRLGIIDAALKQKHRYIAEKHLYYLNKIHNPADIRLRLMLFEAKINCLRADLETDTRRKMLAYAASWTYSHRLLNKEGDGLDADMSNNVRGHIGALASAIERLSVENGGEFANALLTPEIGGEILRDIGATEQSDDPNSVRERLLHYSLDNLRSCCDSTATVISRNAGEHYYALARHCYNRLARVETEAECDEIFQDFVFATLRAMYHDYPEATHYFPCLLRPERLLRNEVTRGIFARECAKLQPWLFLRWRDLLFSYLGTPIASVVEPVVEMLVKTYPSAVAYTYHLTVERNPAVLRDEGARRIRALLGDEARESERFLTAIQYMAQPELYLKHYLNEATKDLAEGNATEALEALLRKVYPPVRGGLAEDERSPRPGNVYKVIARYEATIRALNPEDRDATRERVRRIRKSLDQEIQSRLVREVQSRASKRRLKDYSPYLHEYAGGLEIPGQYTGEREPTPHYHAKIARIDPVVEVMKSLRKPIRISMIGDNGREYKFLVKFGEDLTIDHGLQQLYATMNRTLRNDAGCRQRRLAIDTYEVIPLSKSFGLIQWIEDTRSLEDLVRFMLSKVEIERCESIHKKYATWIANVAPSSKRLADQYKIAVSKYSQSEVTATMNRLIDETRRSALRDAFAAISPSPESFVTLRRNFVASYATMCAAHWIAGVGDRHLQNTLVMVSSGRCLGIDFGHAFGTGVRAPIPELVPFRLTPQILELLRPFTERELLGTIMSHAMRALRDDKGPILACMDIFVHKPAGRRSSSMNDGEDTEDAEERDSAWSSKRNIEIVAKKLEGIHPSFITLEQLKEAHDDKYFSKYHAIVTGNDGSSTRARAAVRNNYLTPTEQVDCLLDQATDLNVLGRMYANWQPWL